MARVDYFNDSNAPEANTLVPAACTIVTDADGKILLHRRRDNELWTIPGGAMEIGESIGECAIRETREETGLEVEPEYVIGIYSNPRHLHAFPDGMVRQQFTVCIACRLIGGELATSDESYEVGFFSTEEIKHLNMHPSIRVRIDHHLEGRSAVVA